VKAILPRSLHTKRGISSSSSQRDELMVKGAAAYIDEVVLSIAIEIPNDRIVSPSERPVSSKLPITWIVECADIETMEGNGAVFVPAFFVGAPGIEAVVVSVVGTDEIRFPISVKVGWREGGPYVLIKSKIPIPRERVHRLVVLPVAFVDENVHGMGSHPGIVSLAIAVEITHDRRATVE